MKTKKPDVKKWKDFVDRITNADEEVEIAIIGKYTSLKDSYISHEETLRYAGALLGCKVNIRWIEAPDLEDSGSTDDLEGVDGVIIPGGFDKIVIIMSRDNPQRWGIGCIIFYPALIHINLFQSLVFS